MPRIYVGTSGWNYPHWKKVFYPPALAPHDWLSFYAQKFPAVEVNYSFYRLPTSSTCRRWFEQTPSSFLFTLKASRYITHIKRLKGVQGALEQFLESTKELKGKGGPIFFQLPPSFKADFLVLESFLKLLPKGGRFAFEFRHPSWFTDEVFSLLKRYNAALVAADSPRYPYREVQTADFFYLRLHGHKVLYASKYSPSQLHKYGEKIKGWGRGGDVFVFFDNDACGVAVQNALELGKLVGA
ncbi:MAG: DUF72 domain-containing protein [Patescibacteria group bacterium]|nr:MAG: DUF72 domain-containing protein [Patescibacteria group bacterium]